MFENAWARVPSISNASVKAPAMAMPPRQIHCNTILRSRGSQRSAINTTPMVAAMTNSG